MDENKLGPLTTPPSARGIPRWLTYVLGIIGFIYILNPTAGVDLIPDMLPLVGNLDEGAAAMFIWYALVEFFEGRNDINRTYD